MANAFGRLRHEKDRSGQIKRRYLEFWATSSATGRSERQRLYSGLTQHGERVPFESDQIAEAFLHGIRADVRAGRTEEQALAPFLFRRAPQNLVRARWEKYVEDREARRERKAVSDQRLYDLRRAPERGYLDYFKAVSIFELDGPMVDEWVSWMFKRWPEHEPKTRHHIVNDFLTFLRWLHGRHEISEVPPKPELPALDRRRRPVPSEDVLDRYLTAIPEEVRGLWLVRARDGLRPSEARKLRVSNYNWRTRMLTIEESKTETGQATFEVDWEVSDWLEKWVPAESRLVPDQYLFKNPRARDGRWRRTPEVRVHDLACKAIGAYFPPNHCGRHAAATHMMQRSRERTGSHDIEAVRRKLRHRESSTTRGYIDQRVIEVGGVSRIRPKVSPGASQGQSN